MTRARWTLAGVCLAVLTTACPPPPLAMPSGDLADGTAGAAYSHTITVAGGTGALGYSASGLPAGLAIGADTGVISGTPEAAGDFSVEVTASDQKGQHATQVYALKIYPAVSFQTQSLPGATAGAPYSATVSAQGGKPPLALSMTGGTLPAGLAFNAGTGALSGTPATEGESGSLVFQAVDANGAVATTTLQLTISPQLTLAATLPSLGNVGLALAGQLQAAGGKAPIAYGVAAGSQLPPGLSVDAGTGAVSGTPTAGGTFAVIFTATDANGAVAPHPATIQVLANLPPSVNTPSLPDGGVGWDYGFTLAVQDGQAPYAWSLESGALPDGLALNPAGAIAGVPTTAGSSTFTLAVTDANGQRGTRAFSIAIYPPLRITTTSLPEGYGTVPYASTMAATGGKPPYNWSFAGALPAGITPDFSTGALSGTPAETGSFPLTLTVGDFSGQFASAPYTLVIYALPQVTTSALADGAVGAAYAQSLQASGGKAPLTWTIDSGALPAGISLDAASGALSGTPAATGTSSVTVRVTDANGKTATRALALAVYAPLAIATASPLADGEDGVAYSKGVASTGGKAPISWAVTSGALPAGLSLDAATGAISGTPSAAGTASFTVTASDASTTPQTTSKSFQLTIRVRVSLTSTLPEGYTGRSYTGSVACQDGAPPCRFSVTAGALPAGLGLNTNTGAIFGNPTAAGSAPFTVTATDSFGATATLLCTVVLYAQPSIGTTSYPDAYLTEAYSASTAGAGGKPPVTWSIAAGSLPAGLTMDAASGAISGTPTGSTQSFTVALADANGVTATRALGIAVYALPAITSTSPLPSGRPTLPYSFTFSATGGKTPLGWAVTAGSLPPGLTLSSAGALSGTIASGASGDYTFTVAVTDANARAASAPFTLTVDTSVTIATTQLATATEGVNYLKAPGVPERIDVVGGTPPYTFSAGPGLPPGISLAATGVFSGVPAQGSAGAHLVTFTVTDASSGTATATLDVHVQVPRPIFGGGADGVAPSGSPLTDTLTVFTQDTTFHPRGDLAVRLRKNGVEFSPVKQQITDPVTGKTVFTGLGLNGTTDTADITVNGLGVINASWQKVNAAVVTIPVMDYPIPVPRAFASGEIDPSSGKLIVTQGLVPNPNAGESPTVTGIYGPAANDVLRLTDATAGTWVEDQVPGMPGPAGRWGAAMAYSAPAGVHVLFGGGDSTGYSTNDVWYYEASTRSWTQPATGGAIPSPRAEAAAAALANGQLVIFGGTPYVYGPFPLGDLYVYDPATALFSARFPSSAPFARFDAAATAVGNLFWMCGGADGFQELSDCWSYDAAADQFTQEATLPGTRAGHAMATGPSGQLYVFGGRSNGSSLNDLLVYTGGAWIAPAQANPPPPREGAVLAVEPSGRLLLFGGRDASGRYYSDLWSYDPTSGAWTQRAPSFADPVNTGFTITGTVSNAPVSTGSRITIEVSGTSGYINRQIIQTPSGSISYVMSGIPPGDTLSLTVLAEDRRLPFPNREWSWIDLGVVATNISGNMSRDVVLPSGPMTSQLTSITGSYTLPPGYLGSWFTAALPRMTRPGYANHPNGSYLVDDVNRTFRADHFPVSPGAGQTLITEVLSAAAPACEGSDLFFFNVSDGAQPPMAFPPGPRSMSPGLNGCISPGDGLTELPGVQGGQSILGGTAVADMDNDGRADLLMLSGDSVDIYLGQSSGEGVFFTPAQLSIRLPNAPSFGLAVADLDRDGRKDVVAGDGFGNDVVVALQTSPGNFTTTTFPTGGFAFRLQLGDFTGDGFEDLVVLSGGITWLVGNGDGTFGPPVTQQAANAISRIADLDGDGKGDLAYAGLDNAIHFLRGTSTGLVDSGVSLPVAASPNNLDLGDLDGDGRNDLAATIPDSVPTLQTWRNQGGAFQFGLATSDAMPEPPNDLRIAELNGDSLGDVVVAGISQTFEYRGTGGGVVSPFFTYPFGGGEQLAIGDVTADGNADVILGDSTPQLRVLAAKRPIPQGTDALSFVAPANTRVYVVDRGPNGYALDYEVVSAGTAGPNAVDFPAVSPLRPSRPAPVGQTVMWYLIHYAAADPARLGMHNFRPNPKNLDSDGYNFYPWLYRR